MVAQFQVPPTSLGALRSTRRRAGATLVEIAIVVAIFGIMSALAAQAMSGMVPSWRTKQAAQEFMSNVQKARDLAISEGFEYRVRIDTWDTDPSGGDQNIGSYYVERGNSSMGSTSWDILPVDDGVSDDGEGTIDFSRGAPNALVWVSLRQPDVTTITFDGRGFLQNSASEFDSMGMVSFNFFDKHALVSESRDSAWTVSVSRAGFSRMFGAQTTPVGSPPGTAGTTSYATTSGGGYRP